MDNIYPNHEVANISQDLSINSDLITEGFELPKDGCFPEKMGTKVYPNGLPPNKTSKWYYDELLKEQKLIKEKNKNRNCSGGEKKDGEKTKREVTEDLLSTIGDSNIAHIREAIKGLSDIEKEVLIQKTQQLSIDIAKSVNKNRGSIPGHIKELLEKMQNITVPSENWKKLLKKQVGSYFLNSRKMTRKKPSRRFKHNPGYKKEKISKILMGIDTSGSMSKVDIAEAFSEINHVYKAGGKIDVVEIDTKINNVYEYTGKPPEYITGRGGTALSPAIEFFNKNIKKYSLLILLTDGYHEKPNIPSIKPIIHLVTSDGSSDTFSDLPYRTIKMKRKKE